MPGSGKSLISGPLERAHTYTHTKCAVCTRQDWVSPGASRAPASKLLGLPQQNTTDWGIWAREINFLTVWKLKSKIKVSVGLICGEASLPGLQTAVPHRALTWPPRYAHTFLASLFFLQGHESYQVRSAPL